MSSRDVPGTISAREVRPVVKRTVGFAGESAGGVTCHQVALPQRPLPPPPPDPPLGPVEGRGRQPAPWDECPQPPGAGRSSSGASALAQAQSSARRPLAPWRQQGKW